MKLHTKMLCFIAMFFLLTFSLAGCGGSSSGGGLADGFKKTAQLDSNTSRVGHFSSFVTDDRIQHLYLADWIGGSGYITAIAFKSNTTTAAEITCPDLTLKMGHTSLSALTDTFANNVEEGKGSLETVLTNAQVVVPVVSVDDYFVIQLDIPFYYNGVDNLVVDFIRTGVCDDTINLLSDNSVSDGSLWSTNLASATGTLDIPLNMEFYFEGGDNTLFSNPSSNTSIPFSTDPNRQRVQQLILASDINGYGTITGLGIQVGNPTSEETYTVSVKLGHATVTTLALDYAANYSDSPVIVADNLNFTFPASVPANSYVWIPLPDAVFTYNGTDNLILEFDVTAATGDTSYTFHDPPGLVRMIYGPSDASVINDVQVAIQHSKLRFNGGTMDTITAENTSDTIPFNTTANQRQSLYRASELGTGGTINRLALRTTIDTVASSDYANFTVMLGHTSLTELTGTFADNMDDATTVFSGLLSIASGLKAGDWIEIPLSSTFSYNGEDNLVVYMSTDGGTANNEILAGGPDLLYTNRHSFVLDNTSTVASGIDNYLVDQRLWLQ